MNILCLYLKLNLILLLTFLAWLLIKNLSQKTNCSLSKQNELRLLRVYFFLALALPIPFLIFKSPASYNNALQKMTIVGQNFSEGIDFGLTAQVNFAGLQISSFLLLLIILALGFAIQLYKNYQNFSRLKAILKKSTSWKNISSVSISFSQEINSPFSTKILGVNQIILPYQLLDSPQNLRLALQHELQHIRNNDLRWVLFLDFIKPLFFWNPAYYAWHNEFHCLQEYACDEALIHKPNINAKDYSVCLLAVASYSCNQAMFASSNMVPNFALFSSPQSQLKRRILMTNHVHNVKHTTPKVLFIATFLITTLLSISFSVVGAQQESDFVRPIETATPKYPSSALQSGTEGWVLVEHSIDRSGNVIQASVIASCDNSGPTRDEVFDKTIDAASGDCLGGDVFNSSAIAAIEQFKFEPTEKSGVRYVFRYALN